MGKVEWDNHLRHGEVCSGKREWRDDLTGLLANYPGMEYVGMTNHQCKPCGKSIFAGCFADFDRHAEMQLQLLILMERKQ